MTVGDSRRIDDLLPVPLRCVAQTLKKAYSTYFPTESCSNGLMSQTNSQNGDRMRSNQIQSESDILYKVIKKELQVGKALNIMKIKLTDG